MFRLPQVTLKRGGGWAPSHCTEGERDLAFLGFGGSWNNRNVPKGWDAQASSVSLESNKWRHLCLINCVSEQTPEKPQISQPKQWVYNWLLGEASAKKAALDQKARKWGPSKGWLRASSQAPVLVFCPHHAGPGHRGAAPGWTLSVQVPCHQQAACLWHGCWGGHLGSWSLIDILR